MLNVLKVASVVGTLVAFVAYHTLPETPGFPALSTENAKILVKTCTRQAVPNPQDPPCLVRYTNNEVGLIVRVEDNLFIARYRIPMQSVTYEELAAMVSQKTLRLIHQTSADWPSAREDFLALVQGH